MSLKNANQVRQTYPSGIITPDILLYLDLAPEAWRSFFNAQTPVAEIRHIGGIHRRTCQMQEAGFERKRTSNRSPLSIFLLTIGGATGISANGEVSTIY